MSYGWSSVYVHSARGLSPNRFMLVHKNCHKSAWYMAF